MTEYPTEADQVTKSPTAHQVVSKQYFLMKIEQLHSVCLFRPNFLALTSYQACSQVQIPTNENFKRLLTDLKTIRV